MKLLYFAWVRERIGRSEEDVAPPEAVRTVADLARVRDIAAIRMMACTHPASIAGAIAWCSHHSRLSGASKASELLRRVGAELNPVENAS